MTTSQLRISDLSEASLQASKWLKCQMLIEADEMNELFALFSNVFLYSTGAVSTIGEGEITVSDFLKTYANYINALKNGKLPEESDFRIPFTSVMTVTRDALFAAALENNKQLIRTCLPIVQLQAHRMDYSKADGKFHSMTFGNDNILWGVQFSYPQLYQNPITKEILTADNRPECPNTLLFRNIQQWTRQHTIPTPMLVNGQKINIPVRLGKQCIPWINQHPQLANRGIVVDV